MNEDEPAHAKLLRLRVYARPGLWLTIGISLAWTVAIVIAPLTIPSGKIVDLMGTANRVDYASLWAELPPVQGAIYYLGDIECHQIASRTILLNGNEMPVCARDASLFFFITAGLVLAAVVRPNLAVSRAIIGMLPARLRNRLDKGARPLLFTWLLALATIAPLGADGVMQLVTSYESTNSVRFLTGIPAGIFLGLLIGLMIQSIHLLPSARRLAQSEGRQAS